MGIILPFAEQDALDRNLTIGSLLGEAAWSGRDHFSGGDVVGTRGTFHGRLWVPNTCVSGSRTTSEASPAA